MAVDDPMQLQQRFGANVRSRRQELELSQEMLARRCGLHRTYISSLERGHRNVALVNIVLLSRALEAPPARLFEGF